MVFLGIVWVYKLGTITIRTAYANVLFQAIKATRQLARMRPVL